MSARILTTRYLLVLLPAVCFLALLVLFYYCKTSDSEQENVSYPEFLSGFGLKLIYHLLFQLNIVKEIQNESSGYGHKIFWWMNSNYCIEVDLDLLHEQLLYLAKNYILGPDLYQNMKETHIA